jgi:hypothetical protein
MVVVDSLRILRSGSEVSMICIEISIGYLLAILICSIDGESIEEISYEAVLAY